MNRDCLRYDGTFPGLLRALGPWLKRGELPSVIEKIGSREPSLFGEPEEEPMKSVEYGLQLVPTPEDLANAGLPAISLPIWRRVWVAFLAENTGIERQIGEYLLLAMARPKEIEDLLTDARVQCILRSERRVRREAHAFKGLLRFQQIDERLYLASVNPETCVLPMISPHFARRFADQSWIIYDRRRRLAAVHENGQVEIFARWNQENLPLQPNEREMQELWRCFFRQTSVRERFNLAAQRRHLPRRYWEDLIEEPGRE